MSKTSLSLPRAVLIAISALLAACGGAKEPPTAPTPVPPASSLPPTAKLSCVVDYRIEPEFTFAVTGVSPVSCDATGSRGDGATYVMDFGDGARVALDERVLQQAHVFQSSRSFVIDVTVTDRYGRVASVSRTVVARTFQSYWSLMAWNQVLWRYETHRLAFDTQSGGQLSGRYMGPDGRVWTVRGVLTAGRQVTFDAANGLTFIGTVPLTELDPFNVTCDLAPLSHAWSKAVPW